MKNPLPGNWTYGGYESPDPDESFGSCGLDFVPSNGEAVHYRRIVIACTEDNDADRQSVEDFALSLVNLLNGAAK